MGVHLRRLLSLVTDIMANAAEQAHHAEGHQHPAAGHKDSVEGQQHPIGIYLKIWVLLFVLSTASYLVDYFHVQGYLRWFLILTFMMLKAGLIVAVFMHMLWERLALMYAILVPPLLLLVLVAIGAFEADYTHFTRGTFFGPGPAAPAPHRPGG
jgi:cytochrome c oxidase subunit IV